MREILEAVILSLVQGLTEFIPVSSEAHLIIVDDVLGFTVGGLAFDVLLHLGTLLALLWYFRRDLLSFAKSVFEASSSSRMVLYLFIATLPAAVAGYFAYDLIQAGLRSLWLIALMLVLVSAVMFVADKRTGARDLQDMRAKDALWIGLAQALALIPGTSRSGATIVAGSLLGFNNAEAARFSFYMAIPILLGASARVLFEPGVLEQMALQWPAYVLGVGAAFVSGYVVIAWLLRYLSRHKLAVFAWYRLALAVILIGILLF